ncbi:MAG TPA: hypothetical protein VM184_00310 [Gaiellaceae bacterium]|nr:hypothetical protein [Gaiellaceae bacterium]
MRTWLSSLFGSRPGGSAADRRSGDRRGGEDRRSSLGVPPVSEERRSGAERRSGRDRRDGSPN